jgi:hypothetical protein
MPPTSTRAAALRLLAPLLPPDLAPLALDAAAHLPELDLDPPARARVGAPRDRGGGRYRRGAGAVTRREERASRMRRAMGGACGGGYLRRTRISIARPYASAVATR